MSGSPPCSATSRSRWSTSKPWAPRPGSGSTWGPASPIDFVEAPRPGAHVFFDGGLPRPATARMPTPFGNAAVDRALEERSRERRGALSDLRALYAEHADFVRRAVIRLGGPLI